MKKITKLATAAALIAATSISAKETIGYFTDYQYYDNTQRNAPWKLPADYWSKWTTMVFAFFDYNEATKNGALRNGDDNAAPQILFGEFDWNPPADKPAQRYINQAGEWEVRIL